MDKEMVRNLSSVTPEEGEGLRNSSVEREREKG